MIEPGEQTLAYDDNDTEDTKSRRMALNINAPTSLGRLYQL